MSEKPQVFTARGAQRIKQAVERSERRPAPSPRGPYADPGAPPFAQAIIRVLYPAGGIAIGATTACQYYLPDHTLSAGGVTIPVANRTGVLLGAAGSTTMGYAAWCEGEYQGIQQVCA